MVIKTDDQVMDRLSTMKAYMPVTADFFATQGREFLNSYAASPSCCQSRAATFVGRYPHNEGVWSQAGGPNLDSRGGIAPYLQRAGYHTAMVGKYLNYVWSKPPGFDNWTTIRGRCPGAIETENCTGPTPIWYYNFTEVDNDTPDGADHTSVVAGDATTGTNYNTTWSGAKFRQYLDAAEADTGKPWYLEFDPTAPHTHDDDIATTMVEPQYRSLDVPACSPPQEDDRSDKPSFVQAFPPGDYKFGAKVVCPVAQRTLKSVDDQFAMILQSLKDHGEMDNTMIIFTSDNGLMDGAHDMIRKFVAYEPSIRVPMLVYWHGQIDPGVDTRLVSNVDILPTALDAAGVPVDPSLPAIDGRTMLSGDGHSLILSEYRLDKQYTPNVPAPIPTWAAMTDSHFKYIEDYSDLQGSEDAVKFHEYYDLDTDPDELQNLLGDSDPSNDPDVNALHDKLTALRACASTVGNAACP